MKNIIFLIISSSDIPVYNLMKNIIDMYCEKSKKTYPLKHFFVEFNENINENIILDKNTIIIKGTESVIPGIALKTLISIEYINDHYKYDYIIRTNLSSFWNIPHLYKLFKNIRKDKLLAGIIIDNDLRQHLGRGILYQHGRKKVPFISGTGIIISYDIAVLLTNKNIPLSDTKSIMLHNDDVFLTYMLKQITTMRSLNNNQIYYLIDINTPLPNNISNILYFRIKSINRNYDVEVFKRLAKRIYDINV